MEMLDEIEKSDKLVSDLSRRRQKKKVELDKVDSSDKPSITSWSVASGKFVPTKDDVSKALRTDTPSVVHEPGPSAQLQLQKPDVPSLQLETGESKVVPSRKVRTKRAKRGADIVTRFDDDAGIQGVATIPDKPAVAKQDIHATDKKSPSTVTSSAKSRWQKAAIALADSKHKPTAAESYNFFTFSFDDYVADSKLTVSQEEVEHAQDADGPHVDDQEGQDTTDKKALVDSQYKIPEIAHYGMGSLYKFSPAEYIPNKVHAASEGNLYFYVQSRFNGHGDTERADGNGLVKRQLEDEGIYVGIQPKVVSSNQRRIEHRFSQLPPHERLSWQNDDGSVMALPLPLRSTFWRPQVWQGDSMGDGDGVGHLVPEVKKPVTVSEPSDYISIDTDGHMIPPESAQLRMLCQLDINVHSILFHHHHLFSAEHVLGSNLTDLYRQYRSRIESNILQISIDKLESLQTSISNIARRVRQLQSAQVKDQEALDLSDLEKEETRLSSCKVQLRAARRKRNSEEKKDKKLFEKLKNTWKQLKGLRQTQDYITTGLKLEFIKKPGLADRARDTSLKLASDIEDHICEIEEDFMETYRARLEDYHERLSEWKAWRHATATATEGPSEEDTARRKPSPPQKFDRDAELLRLQQMYRRDRWKFGEAAYDLQLSMDSHPTPTLSCPHPEQVRRENMQKHNIFVSIVINGKEISKTTPKILTPDFLVSFAEIFSVVLLRWPRDIRLQVWEYSGLSSTKLAEVYVPIPDFSVLADTADLESYQFSSDQLVQYSDRSAAVGSNSHTKTVLQQTPLSDMSDTEELQSVLLTNGIVRCAASWGVDSDTKRPLIPQSTYKTGLENQQSFQQDPIAVLGMSALTDINKLSKWVAESQLDPNDPNNAALYSLIQSGGPERKPPTYFRLREVLPLKHSSSEEKRHTVIRCRWENVPEFASAVKIPSNSSELDLDLLRRYQTRIEEMNKVLEGESLAVQKQNISNFVQRLRQDVAMKLSSKSHKSFHDVVYEDEPPDITALPQWFKGIAEPRHPLRPVKKAKKKAKALDKETDIKLLVNVVRGNYLPLRDDMGHDRPTAGHGTESRFQAAPPRFQEPHSVATISPFVEVMFQGNVQRTSVADGSNPTWNEELVIPFKVQSNRLKNVLSEHVYINVFDEVTVDLPMDLPESLHDTSSLAESGDHAGAGRYIHKRINHNWIGGICIPFSTVYFQAQVEGTLSLGTSDVLISYQPPVLENLRFRQDVALDSSSKSASVTLFATLEPPVVLSKLTIDQDFPTNESYELLGTAERWEADVAKSFKSRSIRTKVIDILGKSVFITRYVSPLNPPEYVLDKQRVSDQAELCARFVSLIPTESDSCTLDLQGGGESNTDIWSTSHQFLSLLRGDEEEHALLLLNYFLHLKKQAWLCIGHGIPEGATCYVLTLETENQPSNFWLWNPVSGRHYGTTEQNLPIKSVTCLVDDKNIWANIQPSDKPADMSFNIAEEKLWKPFFSKDFPYPGLDTIQPASLTYTTTSDKFILEIEKEIEHKFWRAKFREDWRAKQLTRVHRSSDFVKQLLESLESVSHLSPACAERESLTAQTRQQIKDKFRGYKLTGFSVNMPYNNIGDLTKLIYSTRVWDTSTEEFVMSYYICPYPSNVISLWLFIAALAPVR